MVPVFNHREAFAFFFFSVCGNSLKKNIFPFFFFFFGNYILEDARQTVGAWEILTPHCVAHQHWGKVRKSAQRTLSFPPDDRTKED